MIFYDVVPSILWNLLYITNFIIFNFFYYLYNLINIFNNKTCLIMFDNMSYNFYPYKRNWFNQAFGETKYQFRNRLISHS